VPTPTPDPLVSEMKSYVEISGALIERRNELAIEEIALLTDYSSVVVTDEWKQSLLDIVDGFVEVADEWELISPPEPFDGYHSTTKTMLGIDLSSRERYVPWLDSFESEPSHRDRPWEAIKANSDVQAGLASDSKVAFEFGREAYHNLTNSTAELPSLVEFSTPDLPAPETGKWEVSIDRNPLDDSATVVASLTADSGTSGFGDPVTLLLRCNSSQTDAYIFWDDYLGSDDPSVTYRMGESPSLTSRWSLSTNSQATFFPGSDKDFIRELMTVERFVAQTTPYNESPVTAIFDVGGVEGATAELRNACGW
jgi:hypothetical protein